MCPLSSVEFRFSVHAGESEANVRKLFEDAEADQKAHGDASELHVIIFDEIDAICKSRGSVQSGSGATLWCYPFKSHKLDSNN